MNVRYSHSGEMVNRDTGQTNPFHTLEIISPHLYDNLVRLKMLVDYDGLKKGKIHLAKQEEAEKYIKENKAELLFDGDLTMEELVVGEKPRIELPTEDADGKIWVRVLEECGVGKVGEQILMDAEKSKAYIMRGLIKSEKDAYWMILLKDYMNEKLGNEFHCDKELIQEYLDNGIAKFAYENEENIWGVMKDGAVEECSEGVEGEVTEQEKPKTDDEEFNLKDCEIVWSKDDDEFYKSWDAIKKYLKLVMGNDEPYNENSENPLYFIGRAKDEIIGKPQLIENTKSRIILAQDSIKKVKDPETKEVTSIRKTFLFGEKFDTRFHGQQNKIYTENMWSYKVISNDLDYVVFSQEKLPNEVCKFKGMSIDVDDLSELSKSLKIKKLSNIFILKEFKANVETISKEELVKFTKEREISEDDWRMILGSQPDGSINKFPKEAEDLRSSFILGGKENGSPNSLFILGRPGTGKSMGYIEALDYKFNEEPKILEGADSRIKALIPHFKEKPANIGFIANANRVAFIDEIGKMVEFETNKHQSTNSNILGEINFLLDQKIREVGSGNDNNIQVQATAKEIETSNPVKGKRTIGDHVGMIDPTKMGRQINWVQDEEESNYIADGKGIVKFPPTPTEYIQTKKDKNTIYNNKKNPKSKAFAVGSCLGVGGNLDYIMNRDEFLTIFDSCYVFVSIIDDDKINKLVNMSVMLAKEPMKTSVWKPRAYHHVKLLIDGICKQRCLFQDYDDSFIAKQEDYDRVERILIRMVKGWDMDLSPKVEGFTRC